MKVDVAFELDDLASSGWDSLIGPEDLYLSLPWLSAMRAVDPMPTKYALLWQGQELIAGLPISAVHPTGAWALGMPDSVLQRAADAGREGAKECLAAADMLMPSLVCGGRQPGRTGIVARHSMATDAAEKLVTRSEEIARLEGMRSAAFLFVDQANSQLRESLNSCGYRSFESGNYASLVIDENGFDGYLRRFSAHRRRRILAERRQVADFGVSMSFTQLTPEIIAKIAPLEARLYRKHGTSDWAAGHSKFIMKCLLAQFPGSIFVSMAQSPDGVIRGFGIIIEWQGRWYVHTAGFDYDFQSKIPLYFEVAFYSIIETASAAGIVDLQYGLENEVGKELRGCMLMPQYTYFKSV